MAVSTGRHERAQQTRARICTAAKELFLRQGYGATTITDVAKGAGVAHQTVYFVFGSKAGLLAAVLDAEIVGDLDAVPLLQRPEVERIATDADPVRRLQRVVTIAVDVTERLAPLYEIVRGGAADADVRELLDRHEEQRRRSLRALVELVADDLRDLDVDEAADRLYALLSHEVYWLLVQRRGWSAGRWRNHVATEARRQLLETG